MKRPQATLSAIVCVFSCIVCATSAVAATHPMDPLTAEEIESAVTRIRAIQDIPDKAFFPLIRLFEMPKAEVLVWRPGQPIARRAEVIVYGLPGLYRGIVDLTTKTVERWEKINGFPQLAGREFGLINRVVKAHSGWQDAIRKRGISDFSKVIVMPFTKGYYGTDDRDRWLIRTTPFLVDETRNLWGRPIEGVLAMVDMDQEKVVEFADTGIIPISSNPVGFTEDDVGSLREGPNIITYHQPEGASFTVEGNVVKWQNWTFHYRFAPQAGLIISNVSYADQGRDRSIAYQMHMSELFVPYTDPGQAWYYKTFFDQGENHLGDMVSSIRVGLDCPTTRWYWTR